MRFSLTLAAVLYLSALVFATQSQAPAPGSGAPPSARFDMEVRADFFAGFKGDEKRLARAMARCEEVLAEQPDHAEAMVWRGSGLLGMAGMAFQKGDFQKGGELWGKALAEMDRAVALAPDSLAVRIPRGATLFEASRQIPNPKQAEGLVRVAVGDFEHALARQEKDGEFAGLSDHARGELLFGLADGWARLGDKEKATRYFTRLTTDAAKSGRAPYAKAWLDGTPPPSPGPCVGCH